MNKQDLERFVRTTKVKDLRAMAQDPNKARQGYVSQANADGTAGQVKWTKASTKPDGTLRQNLAGEDAETEQRLIASLHEGLPEVKRRSAQERFQVLFERLVQQGLATYRKHGYPIWPRSIADKLRTLGYLPGDPDVYGQCRALAERLFIEAGHKQAVKDSRRTTKDWHGHLNHVIAVPSLDNRSTKPYDSPDRGGLATPVEMKPTDGQRKEQ